MKEQELTEAVIVTHSGTFHADDVFAVAALLLVLEPRRVISRIIRSRDPKEWQRTDFLVDVGGEYDEAKNRFDHHQVGGAGTRPNGVPYAAFGLVWKKFGKDVCSVAGVSVAETPATASGEIVYEKVDKDLVQFIDAMDNGVGELKAVSADAFPYSVGQLIADFNPAWSDDKPDYNKAFSEAVNLAASILQRLIRKISDEISGRSLVEEAYRNSGDKRLIILEKNYPWENVLSKFQEPLFAITPDSELLEGKVKWTVEAVRDNPNSFVNRKDFPANWAGKRDQELADATGVPDAIFCHRARFFAVAKTKNGAIALAKKALEN